MGIESAPVRNRGNITGWVKSNRDAGAQKSAFRLRKNGNSNRIRSGVEEKLGNDKVSDRLDIGRRKLGHGRIKGRVGNQGDQGLVGQSSRMAMPLGPENFDLGRPLLFESLGD